MSEASSFKQHPKNHERNYLAGCSGNLSFLCGEMSEDDVRNYIIGAYEQAQWDVVLALTRINKAGNSAWNTYPIDYWLLDVI